MEFVWGRYSALFYTGAGAIFFIGFGILFGNLWFFFAAGFLFYIFTIFKGRYKFFLFLIIAGSLGGYIADPAIDVQQGEYVIPTNTDVENSETNATQWLSLIHI